MTQMNTDLIKELYQCARAHDDDGKDATASVLRRAGDALQSCATEVENLNKRNDDLEVENLFLQSAIDAAIADLAKTKKVEP